MLFFNVIVIEDRFYKDYRGLPIVTLFLDSRNNKSSMCMEI